MIIERGMSLPLRPWGKWGKLAIQMKIGDSVFLDDEIKAQTLIRVLRRYKRKGSRRMVGDYVFRVWRVR